MIGTGNKCVHLVEFFVVVVVFYTTSSSLGIDT